MRLFPEGPVLIVGLTATPHGADLTGRVTCPLLHTFKSDDETLEGSPLSPSKCQLYFKYASYTVTLQNVIIHLKQLLIH